MPKISKGEGPTIDGLEGHVRAGSGLRAEYEDQKVGELREEAERRGLDASGTKDELAERLVDDDHDRRRDAAYVDPHAQPVAQEVLAGSAAPDEEGTSEEDTGRGDEANNDLRAEYEALTVGELVAELKRRKLNSAGNKSELVDRLVRDDMEYEKEERM